MKFCIRCGAEIEDAAVVCIKCGCNPNQPVAGSSTKFCSHCGAEIDSAAIVCVKCGCSAGVSASSGGGGTLAVNVINRDGKDYKVFDKLTYGICAIILGSIGVNDFIAGNTVIGVIKLVFCWTFIPGIIGLIQGIMALCRPEARLIQTGFFSFEGVEGNSVFSSSNYRL